MVMEFRRPNLARTDRAMSKLMSQKPENGSELIGNGAIEEHVRTMTIEFYDILKMEIIE
jgi:hypothetical protein